MQNSNYSPTYSVNTSSQIDQPSQASTHPAHGTTSPGPDAKVHLKRMALPTFSGRRKVWPECVEVSSRNSIQQANSSNIWIEGIGEGRSKYSHKISLWHQATEEMCGGNVWRKFWRKLESHYEDPSASVQVACSRRPQLPYKCISSGWQHFLKMASLILQRRLGIVSNPCNLELTVFKIYIQETVFEIMAHCL